jgi:uncharacterized membrane protein YeiB
MVINTPTPQIISTAQKETGPVATSERIQTIDVVRGAVEVIK